MPMIQSRSWVLFTTLQNVDRICADINRMLADLNLTEHVFPLELIAREALNNAILHGSRMDPDKKMHAVLEYDGVALRLVVRDEGQGFDWRAVQNREMVPDHRENGRGLKLYRMYADQVEFNEPGNQVTLTRRVDRSRTETS